MSELSKDVSLRLREKFGVEGISIFQMNGTAGDQEEMLYHLHVIPRMTGDWFHEVSMTAGKREK